MAADTMATEVPSREAKCPPSLLVVEYFVTGCVRVDGERQEEGRRMFWRSDVVQGGSLVRACF